MSKVSIRLSCIMIYSMSSLCIVAVIKQLPCSYAGSSLTLSSPVCNGRHSCFFSNTVYTCFHCLLLYLHVIYRNLRHLQYNTSDMVVKQKNKTYIFTLIFRLNPLFGGVTDPDPTVADAAAKAKRLIRRCFVGSGCFTPPFK